MNIDVKIKQCKKCKMLQDRRFLYKDEIDKCQFCGSDDIESFIYDADQEEEEG